MSADVNDLTVNFESDGIQNVKELDKVILSKGAWTTIMFKYQDWDKKNEKYGPAKFTIRRYQKKNDVFIQKSKFNISSIEQAKKIVNALQNWIED